MKKELDKICIVVFCLAVFMLSVSSVSAEGLTNDTCRSCWNDGSCSQSECESLGACQLCDPMNCRSSCDYTGLQGSRCINNGQCGFGLHCSGISTGVRIGNILYSACCPINTAWDSRSQSCRSGTYLSYMSPDTVPANLFYAGGSYGDIIGFDPVPGWSSNLGGVPETCNGIDDDLDGAIDDGVCGPEDPACQGSWETKKVCDYEWEKIKACETCGDGWRNLCDFDECYAIEGCIFTYSIGKSIFGKPSKDYGSCEGSKRIEICEGAKFKKNSNCKQKQNHIVNSKRTKFDYENHGKSCSYMNTMYGVPDETNSIGLYGISKAKDLECKKEGMLCYKDEIIRDGKCTTAIHGEPCNRMVEKVSGDLECNSNKGMFNKKGIWCYKWENNDKGICMGKTYQQHEKGCKYDEECATGRCYDPANDPAIDDYIAFREVTKWSKNVCCYEGEFFDYSTQECSICGVPFPEGEDKYCAVKSMRNSCSCTEGEGRCSQRSENQCSPNLVCTALEATYMDMQYISDAQCCQPGSTLIKGKCTPSGKTLCSDCGKGCSKVECKNIASQCVYNNGVCEDAEVLYQNQGDCNQMSCCVMGENCNEPQITHCSNNNPTFATCCYEWEEQDSDSLNCALMTPQKDSDGDGYTDYVENMFPSHPLQGEDTPLKRAFTFGCKSFFETPKTINVETYITNTIAVYENLGIIAIPTNLGICTLADEGYCSWAYRGFAYGATDLLTDEIIGIGELVYLLGKSAVNLEDTGNTISRFNVGEIAGQVENAIKNFDVIADATKNQILERVMFDIPIINHNLNTCDRIIATKVYVRSYITSYLMSSILTGGNFISKGVTTASYMSKIHKIFKVSKYIKKGSKAFKGLERLSNLGISTIKKIVDVNDAKKASKLQKLGENIVDIENNLVKLLGDQKKAEQIFQSFLASPVAKKMLRADLEPGGSGFSNKVKAALALARDKDHLKANRFNRLFETISDADLRKLGSKLAYKNTDEIISLLKSVEKAEDLLISTKGTLYDLLKGKLGATKAKAIVAKYTDHQQRLLDSGIQHYLDEIEAGFISELKSLRKGEKEELVANLFKKADLTKAPPTDSTKRMKFFIDVVDADTILFREKDRRAFGVFDSLGEKSGRSMKGVLTERNTLDRNGKFVMDNKKLLLSGKDVNYRESRLKALHKIEEKIHRDALKELGESATADQLAKFRRKCFASNCLNDISGTRYNVANLNDQRELMKTLSNQFTVVDYSKNYLVRLKESGYKAIHLIIRLDDGTLAEIQIRTLRQTAWDRWHHNLIYKGKYAKDKEVIEYAEKLSNILHELDRADISKKSLGDFKWPTKPSGLLKKDEFKLPLILSGIINEDMSLGTFRLIGDLSSEYVIKIVKNNLGKIYLFKPYTKPAERSEVINNAVIQRLAAIMHGPSSSERTIVKSTFRNDWQFENGPPIAGDMFEIVGDLTSSGKAEQLGEIKKRWMAISKSDNGAEFINNFPSNIQAILEENFILDLLIGQKDPNPKNQIFLGVKIDRNARITKIDTVAIIDQGKSFDINSPKNVFLEWTTFQKTHKAAFANQLMYKRLNQFMRSNPKEAIRILEPAIEKLKKLTRKQFREAYQSKHFTPEELKDFKFREDIIFGPENSKSKQALAERLRPHFASDKDFAAFEKNEILDKGRKKLIIEGFEAWKKEVYGQ